MEIKRHVPTFEQFVNEATDVDGFNPEFNEDNDAVGLALTTIDELTPGKEYKLTLDGDEMDDMVYQGQTGGEHIFNDEDANVEPIRLSDEEIASMIEAGDIIPVVM